MRLQQVATTWTHKTNILLVVKAVGLDISCIVVTKIWLEWTTFLLVNVMKAEKLLLSLRKVLE
jgi:hypothetical protein